MEGKAREHFRTLAKKKYEEGMSIRSIAEFLGRSYGAAYRLLEEAQVTFRPRGGVRKVKNDG